MLLYLGTSGVHGHNTPDAGICVCKTEVARGNTTQFKFDHPLAERQLLIVATLLISLQVAAAMKTAIRVYLSPHPRFARPYPSLVTTQAFGATNHLIMRLRKSGKLNRSTAAYEVRNAPKLQSSHRSPNDTVGTGKQLLLIHGNIIHG